MNKKFLITTSEQVDTISNGVRQEILDTLRAFGKCSIAEIASHLGRPADALYYHIKKLLTAEIIKVDSVNKVNRRLETVYTLSQTSISDIMTRYDLSDPEIVASLKKMTSAMMKLTLKDFSEALVLKDSVTIGENRNLWASRNKCWLTDGDILEVNQLLHRLTELTTKPKREGADRLCTLTWVLAPVNARKQKR
ncbi:winged helix-turn-helix domain-containing protein [Aliiglaciecola sp. M165]|uniref:winged helix-turn-helix domain-containing protein n=1 Tax=Aliiglaciecola sp. M165 TaxID=2593649 RepID=UPI00163DBA0F|nr:helix-turn-helix domain-containing protein [Aliiglaciecola sp. M165]